MLARGPALLLVVALACAAHGGAVRSGFAFDDGKYLTQNVAVRSFDVRRLTLASYWDGAGSPAPYWRPAAMLTFAAQHAVAGLEPWSYHLASVLLHAATAALVFLLAVGLTGSAGAALLGAALFAVHPVTVEAVASVGHRPDLMAALFGLAAILLHRAPTSAATVAGACAALLLACTSKETGVTVLLPMLAHDLAARHGGRVRELRAALRGRLGAAWAAYAVVAAAYLLARTAVLQGFAPSRIPFLANPAAAQPLWVQKVLALSVLGRTVRLVSWPARLSADYGYDVLELDPARAAPDALLGLAVLAGLAWAAIRMASRRPGVTVGIALAGAAWLPASSLLFPIEVAMAERFLYLPLAGLGIAAAAAAAGAPWRLLAPAGAAAIVALGVRSGLRTAAWRDDETLYAATVAAYPRSARAQFALAQAQRRRGELAEALSAYDRAVAIWPDFSWALCERAALLRSSGRPLEALASARRAQQVDPDDHRTWLCFADELRHHPDRADELLAVLRAGVERFPGAASLRSLLTAAERRRASGDGRAEPLPAGPRGSEGERPVGGAP